MKWYSYYIYYYDFIKQDKLINKIYKLIYDNKQLKTGFKWFFIRYWEGGPHIRLRILSDFEPIDTIRDLSKYVLNNLSSIDIDKHTYYKSINLIDEGEKRSIEAIPWYNEGEIINVDYIPEYSRYGGKHNMDLTETLFMYSSIFVSEILSDINSLALRWMIACNFVEKFISWLEKMNYLNTSKLNYIKNCYESWRKQYDNCPIELKNNLIVNYNENHSKIAEYTSKIINGNMKSITNKITNSIANLHEEISDKTYFRKIIFYHIHMFNNRLGIEPMLECELYYYMLKE